MKGAEHGLDRWGKGKGKSGHGTTPHPAGVSTEETAASSTIKRGHRTCQRGVALCPAVRFGVVAWRPCNCRWLHTTGSPLRVALAGWQRAMTCHRTRAVCPGNGPPGCVQPHTWCPGGCWAPGARAPSWTQSAQSPGSMRKRYHDSIRIIMTSPPLLPRERWVSRTMLTTDGASRVQASTMWGDDNPPWGRAINQVGKTCS